MPHLLSPVEFRIRFVGHKLGEKTTLFDIVSSHLLFLTILVELSVTIG